VFDAASALSAVGVSGVAEGIGERPERPVDAREGEVIVVDDEHMLWTGPPGPSAAPPRLKMPPATATASDTARLELAAVGASGRWDGG
jgi:hypothetical protein